MSELKFESDTKQRKVWFTGVSFSHPAKMSLPLQLWLIDNYTKPGETILDCMGGSGTILVACSLGRHVICVDLEQKFVDMMKGNWEKIKQRGPQMGYTMGTATILQGDARNLEGILADKIITSPPFANAQHNYKHGLKVLGKNFKGRKAWETKGESIDKIITSPPYAEAQSGGGIAQKGYQGPKHSPTDLVGKRSYMPEQAGQSEGQISNLPYGSIDSVITSPPYAETLQRWGNKETETMEQKGLHQEGKQGIGALPYGNIDSIITSPPYEGSDISQTHMTSDKRGAPDNPNYRPSWKHKLADGYADTKRPYHEVDSIITSPPYEGTEARDRSKESWWDEEREKKLSGGSAKIAKGYQVDAVITSPPYEGSVSDNKESPLAGGNEEKYGRWKKGTAKKTSYAQDGEPCKVDNIITSPPYEGAMDGGSRHTKGGIPQRDLKMKCLGSYDTENKANIGNLYKNSYLEAMLQVYSQCFKVLKLGGLMILVVKNFIRDKKEVDLRTDTRKLCEQIGFEFIEEHYRVLTNQSFWRTIYQQKYPDAPKVDKEYILVFKKVPLEVK